MVREALRLEREAAARYTEHPAASSDPRLVAYWESLRRNETEHRDLLEGWLRERGVDPACEDPPDAALGAAALDPDAVGRHPLAPREDEGRGHAGDLSALRDDYELEDQAVVIYGHFAYQAEDRELMELFKELARSESGHRNGLRRTIRTTGDAGDVRGILLPALRVGDRLRPRPRGGHRGQVPHVPGALRAAPRRAATGPWRGWHPEMSDDARTAGGRPGDPIPPEARAANLELWNHWTKVHEKSAFYDVEGFKAGATSLWPVEREELGPFVHDGTTLLHLQCHFGLDTLSWARLGAEVVGLDLSDEAIALARRLADEVGLSGRAEFVCADLYDADAHLGDRRFDVVFVSWGAIEWLPDLDRWAAHHRPPPAARRHLLHGRDPPVRLRPGRGARASTTCRSSTGCSRRRTSPDVEPIEGSYADRDADTTGLVAYGWQHSLAEVTGALIGAGLRRRAPARVPHLARAVLGLDDPGRRPLVVAAGRRGRPAQGPAAQLLAARDPGPRPRRADDARRLPQGESRELGRGRRAPRRLGAVRRGRVQGRPHRR